MTESLLADDACRGIHLVEQPALHVTGQSDRNYAEALNDMEYVAKTLQQWLSQGRTIEESLLLLFAWARQSHAAADGRVLTSQVVRVGFNLWRRRQWERAAVQSTIQNWYAEQPQIRTAIADDKPSATSVCRSPRGRSGGQAAEKEKTTVVVDGATKKGTPCKDTACVHDNLRQIATAKCNASSVESAQIGCAGSHSLVRNPNNIDKTDQDSDLQPVKQPEGNMQHANLQQQCCQQQQHQQQKQQQKQRPVRQKQRGVQKKTNRNLQLDEAATVVEPTSKAPLDNCTAATTDSVQGLCHKHGQKVSVGDEKFGVIGLLHLLARAPSVGVLAQVPGCLGHWLTELGNASDASGTNDGPGSMCKEDRKKIKACHSVEIGTPPKKMSKRRRLTHGSNEDVPPRLHLPPAKAGFLEA